MGVLGLRGGACVLLGEEGTDGRSGRTHHVLRIGPHQAGQAQNVAAGAMPVITTESLEYKAAWYGRELVTVDRFFPSSTLCSGCGAVQEKPALNVREWRPVLERMRAEHVGGTDPWTGFQARVTDPGSGDAERVESELDRLSGGSDARLEHEETFLVTAMNQLPART